MLRPVHVATGRIIFEECAATASEPSSLAALCLLLILAQDGKVQKDL